MGIRLSASRIKALKSLAAGIGLEISSVNVTTPMIYLQCLKKWTEGERRSDGMVEKGDDKRCLFIDWQMELGEQVFTITRAKCRKAQPLLLQC